MTEWAYKATTKKRSYADTERLANDFGFVARSAYQRSKDSSRWARIMKIDRVASGDILHIYYRDKKGPHPLGSSRIRDAGDMSARFTPVWPKKRAAIVKVLDMPDNRALLDALERQPEQGDGYFPDPRLEVFTGWLVEPLRDRTPPDFDDIDFPQMHTLVDINASALERGTADADLLTRVVHDPQVMGGKPCIRGTRVTIGMILGLLSSGKQPEAILTDFPYLTALDIRAALAYAAWRMQERELPVEAA